MALRLAVHRFAALALAIVVSGACNSTVTPGPSATAQPSPAGSASGAPSASPVGPLADTVFLSAKVETMDDAKPTAQAVAVKGDTILAVGSNEEIARYIGPATSQVDLAGVTLLPGFIDAHQHRIGDGPSRLGKEPKALIDDAIEQGYTTIDELYVDEGRLAQLQDLDRSGVLRLRVNAYLPIQENSAEGKSLGNYFEGYRVGQVLSPHVRVAGLKVFTDFDNATILLWKQPDLNARLLELHQQGWHLAIKTVATNSLAMILKALQSVKAADPSVVDARVRTEHTLFATADQIEQMKALGVVPTINLNNPGTLLGTPDQKQLLASNPAGSYTPWKSMFAAGLAPAGISGFPSGFVDEPEGAPFGSPIHLIYQGVTRVGNLGAKSPAAFLGEALTAEQSLRALTINAARAGWEDDTKGSVTAGKLADLVVLSVDPVTGDPGVLNDIRVVMTIIGGKVEWCAPGWEEKCPVPGSGSTGATPGPSANGSVGTNVAPTATVTASSELTDRRAANLVDGSDAYWQASGLAPQSVELALPSPTSLAEVRLKVAQKTSGPSTHELWIRHAAGELEKVKVFDGVTQDGDVLVYEIPSLLANVDLIKVVTTSVDGLFPAWHEIELIQPQVCC